MNPSRRDKWPAYRPTRHVLVLRKRRFERPWQGYVIDWKHHSYKWEALVVYQDETLEGSPWFGSGSRSISCGRCIRTRIRGMN